MNPPAAANTNRPCPICGKPPQPACAPFCSSRCADIDLHRWLGETYRVESNEAPAGPAAGGDDDGSAD